MFCIPSAAVQFAHDGRQIGLFPAFQKGTGRHHRGRGVAEIEGHEVLPHHAGELDGGLAVGAHTRCRFHGHAHLHFAIGDPDGLNPSNVHARQFDGVACFEITGGVEAGLDRNAAAEKATTPDHLKQDERSHEDQGEKEAQSGFQRVFHSDQSKRDIPQWERLKRNARKPTPPGQCRPVTVQGL